MLMMRTVSPNVSLRHVRSCVTAVIYLVAAAWVPAARSATPSAVAEKVSAAEPRTDRYGDPLPDGVLSRIGSVRMRQAGWISALAYSPDGKILLATTGSGLIGLWDVATGKSLRQFKTADRDVCTARLSREGRRLFCIASDWKPRWYCWDTSSGELLQKSEVKDRAYPDCVAIAPSGERFALGRYDRGVRVYESTTGRELVRIPVPTKDVRNVAFSSDSKAIAVCDRTDSIRVHDASTGKEVSTFTRKGATFELSLFSSDDRLLAGVTHQMDSDATICIWERVTRKEIRTFTLARTGVASLSFSQDAKLLAVAALGKGAVVWHLETGRQLSRCPTIDWARSVALSADGKTGAACNSAEIEQFETATGRRLAASYDFPTDARNLRFSADGRSLFSLADVYSEWDTATGRELHRFAKFPTESTWIKVLSPDLTLIASPERGGPIGLWDAATGRRLKTFVGHGDHAWAMVFSPDSRRLISASNDKTIRVWDVSSGRELRKLVGHGDMVSKLALSADGRWLASTGYLASDERVILLWDLAGNHQPRPFNVERSYVDFLTISRDGRYIGAVLAMLWPPKPDNRLAMVWDTASGKECCRLNLGEWNTAIDFSPDSRMLATASDTGVIRLWELPSAQQRRRIADMQGAVGSLTFSPDGRLLAASSSDVAAYVWELIAEVGMPLTKERLEQAWKDVAERDAPRAYDAVRTLSAHPKQAIQLLTERLHPSPALNSAELSRLIRNLDSKRFSERQKASTELVRLGSQAEPELRKALNEHPSAETRAALTRLLEQMQNPASTTESLRVVRAVEVIEQCSTQEARALLEKLASGDPNAQLTREAKITLARLSARAVPLP